MTTRRKSFTSATYNNPIVDEREVELNGETFKLVDMIPGAVLLDFLANQDMEDPAAMAKVLYSLFDEAIIPEDVERFKAFIRDPKAKVDLEVLAEVAGYIAEEFSGRPLPQSS